MLPSRTSRCRAVTPARRAASDAEAITNLADTSLVVVRQDFVHTRQINDAIDLLNASEAKVLGFVLNDAATLSMGFAEESAASPARPIKADRWSADLRK